MLSYLAKFNNLPAELRQKVSDKNAMAAIEALEQKYGLALAALVMKVMVKEAALAELPRYLLKENLTPDQAGQLAQELKEKIFFSLGDYLSAPGAASATAPIRADEALAVSQPAVKGASFFFSPDDEAEIRELAKKIDLAERAALPDDALEEKLGEILSKAQINFGSADLAGRFRQILKTYLRGIRNKLETMATLTKPFLSGGLSFDQDSAGQVMALADKIVNNKAAERTVLPAPKISIPAAAPERPAAKPDFSRDAAYDFSRLKKIKEKISNDLKTLDTRHELPVPPKLQRAEPAPPAKPAEPLPNPLIRRRFEAENLNASPKVKIEDVKYVPKVMGPLDELKFMDLASFRRLDNLPERMAEKIKNKINLLEDDGYAKRLEGVKSWRQSPANKLYLSIGQSSIGENRPVDVIIEERKAAGEEYLTSEEFKAIMDLNKSLRF